MSRRLALFHLLLIAVLLSGCVRAERSDPFDPRIPDDQGVVTAITRESLTIDEGNSYDIDEKVESFLTYRPTQPVRILERKGQYVHLGLERNRVVWIGGIGEVIESGGRRVTFYIGSVKRIDGRRVVFVDGTVLRLADGVHPPAPGSRVRMAIDVASDLVFEQAVELGLSNSGSIRGIYL